MSKLTIPSPLEELLGQFLKRCGYYATKQSQKLSQLPKEAIQRVLAQFHQKRDGLNRQVESGFEKVVNLCSQVIRGPHICVEVESKEIRFAKNFSKPVLIKGKVKFTPPGVSIPMVVDCFLACGHWAKLGDIKEDKINIVEHLEKLLPKYQGWGQPKGPIGLVTFQNGIMNDFNNDFKQMSQLIIDQFPEGPLCIGLHNATTHDLRLDMGRFLDEPLFNKASVYSLCQMIKTFADLLSKINPNVVWTHFAHSEGGLIANAVLTLCNQSWLRDVQKYLKEHLVIATYGAVKPVPSDPVLDVVNTYSKKDIALFFGSFYLNKALDQIAEDPYISTKVMGGKTYEVTIIDSKLPFDPLLKIKFEMPEVLTIEQRLNMSWMEWMSHHQDLEDSPRIAAAVNTTIVSTINEKVHAIADHGFAKDSYKSVLKKNIDDFREIYRVYDAKRLG